MSLTFLARGGCSYFEQYGFCDLYDVNDNFLLRCQIQSEDLLVVDIQDFLICPTLIMRIDWNFNRRSLIVRILYL